MSTTTEEAGLAHVTNSAVDRRLTGRIEGEVHPHYQLRESDIAGRFIFWVETYGGNDSSHWVEVQFMDGEWFASCDCIWFLNYRSGRTTCVHIAKSIEVARKR